MQLNLILIYEVLTVQVASMYKILLLILLLIIIIFLRSSFSASEVLHLCAVHLLFLTAPYRLMTHCWGILHNQLKLIRCSVATSQFSCQGWRPVWHQLQAHFPSRRTFFQAVLALMILTSRLTWRFGPLLLVTFLIPHQLNSCSGTALVFKLIAPRWKVAWVYLSNVLPSSWRHHGTAETGCTLCP